MKKSNGKPVALMVTTAHRGVFFGYGQVSTEKTIRLTAARMAVYWDSALKGVLGLASEGPGRNCKIGPSVDAITLHDVTSVIEVSEGAAKKWEAAPWG